MPAMPRRVPRTDITVPQALPGEIHVADRLLVEVDLLGAVDLGPFWTYPDLCSPGWRLYLNREPGAAIVLGRRTVPLPAGHPVLIPPWLHFASRPGPRPVRHRYVHFTAPGLPGDLVRRLFPAPIDLHPAPEVAALLERLDVPAGTAPTAGRLLAAKAAAFAGLARAMDGLGPAAAALVLERIGAVTPVQALAAAIDADPGADWSAARIAAALGCGRDHAARRFRREFGATPRRHLAERRLAAAARLLATGSDGIDAIATACGFATRFSFTRAFVRRFGRGPAAYRAGG
jgi:AraC-like DNA-binding protein